MSVWKKISKIETKVDDSYQKADKSADERHTQKNETFECLWTHNKNGACDAIFTVYSQTFILFWLTKTLSENWNL